MMISDHDPVSGIRIDIRGSRSLQTLYLDSRGVESDLKTLIERRQLAVLANYQPENCVEVARVCLEMAQSHLQEVTVLLWSRKIAVQATVMLCDEAQDFTSEARMALVRAILNAGHHMDVKDRQWPKAVRIFLQNRQDVRDEHWYLKSKKFREKPKDPLKAFPIRMRCPYYSLNEAKSTENLNGVLGEVGRKYLCRHLTEAIKDDPKRFLKRISQREVSSLDYNALELQYSSRRSGSGRRTVQFTAENFGRLLVRVASLIPSGESRSYEVYYLSAKRGILGHSMRVFLRKELSKSWGQVKDHPMELKVSLYEPNVTGDMKHLRELTEDLARLTLWDFGVDQVSDVWGLDLEDEGLAHALGGQFIESEINNKNTYLQIGRFLNALAIGNLREMHRAAELVQQGRGFKSLNSRVEQLAGAMSYALQDGHAPEIREVTQCASLLDALEKETLEALIRAKNGRGGRGFLHALRFARAEAVEAFGGLLAKVEHRLEPATIEDVIAMPNGLGEAMKGGLDKTVQVFGQVLLMFQKRVNESAMQKTLFARDKFEVTGLSNALENNQSAVIRTYGKLVLAADLKPSLRAELLWEPAGLKVAVDKSYGESIMAYLDVVITLQPLLDDRGLLLWKMIHGLCMKRFLCLPCVWVKTSAYQILCKKFPEVQAQLDKMWRNIRR